MGYRESARDFVQNETQFHLGFLPTESSHPKTRDFARAAAESTVEGVRQLLSVDEDIGARCGEWFDAPEFEALSKAFRRATLEDRRIVFSGCGATGRLAVLLESMWRRFWREVAMQGTSPPYPDTASNARGIITGGDRALINAVEGFEDFEAFGREQVRELQLAPKDLVIAMSEGGETASVVGSAIEAIDEGCTVFFVHNNPTELLADRIERSHRLITRSGVTPIDLTTGAMALSGSTRMQATTSALLFVAAAMEDAVCGLLSKSELKGLGLARRPRASWCEDYARLVSVLEGDAASAVVADIVETEVEVYRARRIVAYSAERYLLDILADTTERAPTFSLPPWRRIDEPRAASDPWAIAFLPGRAGRDAWSATLGRRPIGLDWSADTYRRLETPQFEDNHPDLGGEEIERYPLGEEVFSLYGERIALVMAVHATGFGPSGTPRADGARGETLEYRVLSITSSGEPRPETAARGSTPRASEWNIELPLPRTGMDVYHHLAVKLVFNTVSTSAMAKMGRVQGNWMVCVSPTNKKLIDRSIRIIADLTGRDYGAAAEAFFQAYEEHGAASPVRHVLGRGT